MEETRYIPKLKKDRVPVTIYTTSYKIVGEVHCLPVLRLTDMMNDTSQNFLPVTNVNIFDQSGEEIVTKLDFLTINKNHITMLCPLTTSKDELKQLLKSTAWSFSSAE